MLLVICYALSGEHQPITRCFLPSLRSPTLESLRLGEAVGPTGPGADLRRLISGLDDFYAFYSFYGFYELTNFLTAKSLNSPFRLLPIIINDSEA